MLSCNKCFFYDLEEKGCAERHHELKEGEECRYYVPNVAIDYSFEDQESSNNQPKIGRDKKRIQAK